MTDDMLTVREAAAVIGVQISRVREMIDLGRLPAEKDDRGWWRVPRQAATEYATSRPGRKSPVTEDIDAALAGYRDRLAALKRQSDDELDRRNRAIVEWVDRDGIPVNALARRIPLGRQQVQTILAQTRAKIAEEQARAEQRHRDMGA